MRKKKTKKSTRTPSKKPLKKSAALSPAKSPGSLAPTDPTLQAYMRDIHRIPLLSKEEEHSLAISYYENKDKLAFQKLVASNLRFVVKVAYEYIHYRLKLLDLIQEGNLGLLKAVEQFDPYKGVRLTTYAVWWIRSFIQDYILKNYSLVKLGTTQNQKRLFYRLKREQNRLEQLGISGSESVKLLAEKFDVKEKEIEQMDERMNRDLSLQTPLKSDSKTEHSDRIADPKPGFIDRMGETEQLIQFQEVLKEFSASLEGREKQIFEKRLVSENPLTLQEIGDQFGFTKERARQIEENIKQRLKEYMQEKYPEYKVE